MSAAVQLQAPPSEDVALAPSDLLELARSRSSEDRQRLLLGIAALCDAAPAAVQPSEVLVDVFMILARQAEREIRAALSQSLAGAEWAPPSLINMLALDEIEIARPVIARSPLLKDHDLLRILVESTIEHQIEVARRPRLSGLVADAIIDRAEPACVTALATNRTAEISEAGLGRLVEQSRRVAALRAPLTRHPRLSTIHAQQLYQWVGQALRQAIGERFRIDEGRLAGVVDQAVTNAGAPQTADTVADGVDRDEMERRLVAKLQSAGQLRPGFVIRAIREKRLGLFEHALAALSGFPLAQVRRAVRMNTPDALFLLCTAVGIDRAVFQPVLDEIRKLSDGWPGDAGEAYWSRMSHSPNAAAREFRALMGGLH